MYLLFSLLITDMACLQTLDVSDHYPVEFLMQTASRVVRIGAFNIEILGVTKMSKPDVVAILVEVAVNS